MRPAGSRFRPWGGLPTRAAWLAGAALALAAGAPAWGQGAGLMSVPRPVYFSNLANFYAGNYRDALEEFLAQGRSGIKNGPNRWIDSICYHTMCGECYRELGQHGQALEHYTTAVQLYVAFYDWMVRVQFEQAVRPAGAGAVKAVPWGEPKRVFRVGAYKDTYLIGQGNIDNSAVVARGGVVQQAVLFPINATEIVRATALAIRRRREIMGPLCPHDPLTSEAITMLSRRPCQPNHWSEAFIDAQLGMALAAGGKDAQAKTVLERALVAGGEYDHPLTGMVLLELGRLALAASDFESAARYFEEATYAAVNFYDPAVLEEAFRLGFTTHVLLNRPGMCPLLLPAADWAKRQDARQLQLTLMLMAAENASMTGQAKAAAGLLNDARVVIGRRDLLAARQGAWFHYLTALNSYQQGSVEQGDPALAAALAFQSKGSLRLFQILLTDRLLRSPTNPLSARVAMDIYTTVLRDPTPSDWLTDPLESLSVLTVAHAGSFENWFGVALARKEYERALEIADLARRHAFLSSLEFGGRLLNLRWVIEGPAGLLGQEAALQRKDLLIRFPNYEKLSLESARIKDELRKMPLAPQELAAAKAQAAKLAELTAASAAQETMLREMALRREPCELVFPPVRHVKDVQAALPDGTAVLVFFSTSQQTHGFLMTGDKFGTWIVPPLAQVQRELVSLLRGLGNYDANKALKPQELADTAWKKPAAELLTLLTKDSKANLPYNFKELVIVPDNILWYVPFEVLQSGEGDRAQCLLHKVKIRYTPTLGLAAGDARPRLSGGNMAVVLGRLVPGESETVNLAAFQELERSVPGSIAVQGKPPAPSGIYTSLLDRMIVLGDIVTADKGLMNWMPVPTDSGAPMSTLASWLSLPWGAPDQVILPGFHTPAENALKTSQGGADVFLSLCGLMGSGSRTVLLARWRPGGQSSRDLVREFAQELPHMTAAAAWQRSVMLVSDTQLVPGAEPRVTEAGELPKADHPFFWAGYLLADLGAQPQSAAADKDPAAELLKPRPQ